MGTSVGSVIDYIVAGLAAPVVAADPTAVVVDGVAEKMAQSMVFIGKGEPEASDGQDGSQQLLVLGAGRAEEEYDIPCFAYAFRAGPTMKPARDAAIVLFDTVAHFVANDRTFGGLLLQGRSADVRNIGLIQDVGGEAGAARIAWVSFTIHCKSHYIP